MCTYARTMFDCNHVVWARRVKVCTIAEDFQQGILPQDCAFKKPHGLKSTKLARRCDKCIRLDERLSVARRKLDESREEFGKRWTEPCGRRSEDDDEKNSDGVKEGKEGGDRKEEEGWIYSENGKIKTSRCQAPEGTQSIQEEHEASNEKDGASSSSSIPQGEPEDQEGSISTAHTRSSFGESQITDFTSDTGSLLSTNDSEYLIAGKVGAASSTGLAPSSSNEARESGQVGTTIGEIKPGMKPKTTPKSRLALPVSRTPKVEKIPPVQAATEVKRPETLVKTTPRSLPKSRLAVPVSKTTPPRNVKPAETLSKLPRPGASRKLNR